MIRPIVTNKEKLSIPVGNWIDLSISEVIKDLVDTAEYHQKKPVGCVGLAANQIGHDIPVITIWHGGKFMIMGEPKITKMFGGKDWKREGCLSVQGKNPRIQRNKKIRISFFNINGDFKENIQFTGFTARVIQHEVDHLNGVTI